MKIQGVNMNRSIILGILALSPMAAMDTLAESGGQLQADPSTNARPGVPSGPGSRTGSDTIIVQLETRCYAINLRTPGMNNPLSPNSVITAHIPISVSSGGGEPKTYNMFVKFPGDLATSTGMSNPDHELDPSFYGSDPAIKGMSGSLGGNMAEVQFKGGNINIELDADGTQHTTSTTKLSAGSPTFDQKMNDCNNTGPVYGSLGWSTFTPTYPCGAYMGHDGPLTANIDSIIYASDQSMVTIKAAFPGQTGFCGGYFSPLMLFFDAKRPTFTGSSPFKLSAASKTYWVEKNSPGWFLALDRNGNGKIDGPEELFGNQDDKEKNGFDELAALDSNHDGVIDAKDEMFSKLLLWNDKNGDGISQPGELEPISKRVVKISLKYRATHNSYGKTAQARQVGEFWFKGAKGKLKKGSIEDIWFAPMPGGSK